MEPKRAGFSERAGEVWGSLSDEEKKAIQKNYPFQADRNQLLKKLKSRGVSIRILAEISGISASHTERICIGRKSNGKKIASLKILEAKIQDVLSTLRRCFD